MSHLSRKDLTFLAILDADMMKPTRKSHLWILLTNLACGFRALDLSNQDSQQGSAVYTCLQNEVGRHGERFGWKCTFMGRACQKIILLLFQVFFFTRGHRGGTRAETQVRGQVQRFCPPRWPLSPHYDGLPIHRSSFKLNWHAPETKFANVPINAYLSATYHYERSTRMSVFLRTCNAWKWRDVQ